MRPDRRADRGAVLLRRRRDPQRHPRGPAGCAVAARRPRPRGGSCEPIKDAVVDIWHCDAGRRLLRLRGRRGRAVPARHPGHRTRPACASSPRSTRAGTRAGRCTSTPRCTSIARPSSRPSCSSTTRSATRCSRARRTGPGRARPAQRLRRDLRPVAGDDRQGRRRRLPRRDDVRRQRLTTILRVTVCAPGADTVTVSVTLRAFASRLRVAAESFTRTALAAPAVAVRRAATRPTLRQHERRAACRRAPEPDREAAPEHGRQPLTRDAERRSPAPGRRSAG